MISIIVPIYNSSQYLCRCLDSIINQDYQDIEIILVDDGSTDDTPKICDQYASKDTRIHVIHKANEGVSIARNVGIDNAHGEWIAFVDSDDWIESDYISTLFSVSEGHDIVTSNCTVNKEFKNNSIIDYINSFGMSFLGNVCHHKLIKTNIIRDNHISFDSHFKLGEDSLFSLLLNVYCKSIMLITYQGYHYQESDLFISEKYNQSFRDITDKIDAISHIYRMLKDKYSYDFNLDYIIKFNISFYPITKIINSEEDEYIKLYQLYFPSASTEYLYNDSICSPQINSITYIKYLARSKKYKRMIETTKKVYARWGKIFSSISYPYSTHKKIGKLIGSNHLLLAYMFLFIYSFVKR